MAPKDWRRNYWPLRFLCQKEELETRNKPIGDRTRIAAQTPTSTKKRCLTAQIVPTKFQKLKGQQTTRQPTIRSNLNHAIV